MIVAKVVVLGSLLLLFVVVGVEAIWRQIDDWREERERRMLSQHVSKSRHNGGN